VGQLGGAGENTILALRDVRRRGAVGDDGASLGAAAQPPSEEGNDAASGGLL
jgi:hypothetical protein